MMLAIQTVKTNELLQCNRMLLYVHLVHVGVQTEIYYMLEKIK